MNIPSVIIQAIIALTFIMIGISQARSDKVAFFSTTNSSPRKENITNLRLWNLCHGTMWIAYGALYLVSAIISFFIQNSILMVILIILVTVIPLPVICLYHSYLKKKYLIHND